MKICQLRNHIVAKSFVNVHLGACAIKLLTTVNAFVTATYFHPSLMFPN